MPMICIQDFFEGKYFVLSSLRECRKYKRGANIKDAIKNRPNTISNPVKGPSMSIFAPTILIPHIVVEKIGKR